jgi:hypothetical protein
MLKDTGKEIYSGLFLIKDAIVDIVIRYFIIVIHQLYEALPQVYLIRNCVYTPSPMNTN